MLIPAAVLAVVALSGCTGQEKTEVFTVTVNGKPVECVQWSWSEAGTIEEVALACDFGGFTK